MPELTFDETRYGLIADAFLRKITDATVSVLVEKGVIALTADGLSESDDDIVYNLLFRQFIQIEDLGGFDVGNARFVGALAFGKFPTGGGVAGKPVDASELLVTEDGTEFHGGLTSEIIQAAARKLL